MALGLAPHLRTHHVYGLVEAGEALGGNSDTSRLEHNAPHGGLKAARSARTARPVAPGAIVHATPHYSSARRQCAQSEGEAA